MSRKNFFEGVLNMSGRCVDSVWKVSKRCVNGVLKLYGKCLKSASKVILNGFERHLEGF